MQYFIGDNDEYLLAIDREQIRDAIVDNLKKLNRPVRPIEVAKEINRHPVAVAKCAEHYPSTFTQLFAHHRINGRQYEYTYIGYHRHHIPFNPNYDEFGHLTHNLGETTDETSDSPSQMEPARY